MFSKLATFRRAAADDESAVVPTLASEPVGHDTIEIALPAAMLTRFVTTLAEATARGRLDRATATVGADTMSPDAIERLLVSAIRGRAGSGSARVTRSPAGLHSPEYWQITLTDADPTAIAVVSGAARGIGPA